MMTDLERTEQHLPLNPRTYAIMLVLSDEPAHGYRIKREVEERSDGAIELDPGSLYRVIAKLVRDNLVEERSPGPDADERRTSNVERRSADPRRRYYVLTAFGLRVAQAETERLNALMQTVSAQALLKRGQES